MNPTVSNAAVVRAAPFLRRRLASFPGRVVAETPVITMTSAVIVQTTTVSMNGSSSATMPSRTG